MKVIIVINYFFCYEILFWKWSNVKSVTKRPLNNAKSIDVGVGSHARSEYLPKTIACMNGAISDGSFNASPIIFSTFRMIVNFCPHVNLQTHKK